jgi:hypothetical protein
MTPQAHDQAGIFLRFDIFASSPRANELDEHGRITGHAVRGEPAAAPRGDDDLFGTRWLELLRANEPKHALANDFTHNSNLRPFETCGERVDRRIRNRLVSGLGSGS